MEYLKAVYRGICFFVLASALNAQKAAPENFAAPGERLALKIAVIGPGDQLYFWWGHVALVIEDELTGTARFYDYGLFSFENEHFFTNFAMGRLFYSCGASKAESNYNAYIKTNRDITLYTLDIAPEKREEVRRFAEKNILPENRNYYYHHFRDNCSTRIRDIIDLAVDGQFKQRFGEAPGRFTLRQHVRRHTWFSPFMDWILNFLMGQDIDVPITIWEEMFLPSEIARRIQDFAYQDPSGAERRLVSRQETLNRARGRPVVLDAPRKQWPRELLAGCVIAAALILCMSGRKKHPKRRRILLGLSQSLLGLFFGIAGSMLFFMTFFSDHDYTYHNSNILYINPLLLVIVPLGFISAFSGVKAKSFFADQLLRAFWTYTLFGCMLSMAIKLFPGFYQQNQVTQALTVPFALTLSFIPRWIGRALKIGDAGLS
ncbi:MAG: DUF4105 domain-containing protein [Spirochaetaceae bacterium]|jgi:hypothetical protein|nr:DUF4105 domain-containing protein [Spirochaetaceae bacterium]